MGRVFSLNGTDSLTESIAALTSSEETLAEMSRQGLEWSARFTWDKTALRTLEVYREVLEESSGSSR